MSYIRQSDGLEQFELFTSKNQNGGIRMNHTDGIEHIRPLDDSKRLTAMKTALPTFVT